MGNPLGKNTDSGAINERMQLDKICELVDSGLKQGAELVQPRLKLPDKGYWYPPSFFTGVTASHRIAQEEIFGPVLSVMTFRTPEEAIAKANNTPYGLASYFYSRDVGRIWRVSEGLEYGIVGINTGVISTEVAPFGGVKESGIGREGSKYGIDEWLELKYLCMGGIDT